MCHVFLIVWFDVGVRLVLRLDERIFDILKHGEVDQSCDVVPIEVDPKVAFDAPIMLNGIEFTKLPHKVSGVMPANIFDAKIIST